MIVIGGDGTGKGEADTAYDLEPRQQVFACSYYARVVVEWRLQFVLTIFYAILIGY